MKTRQLSKIFLVFFLLPMYVWAQPGSITEQDLTGMWRGTLYNDTTQKLLTYELAISEEKGKLTGYSYTIFEIDGKKEVGVKKIKIKRKNDELVIEDLLLISNNYSAPPPRGVRQMSVVNFSANDTAMLLNGRWSTNPTREYRPLTGSLHLQRAADFRPVALYKKLEELHLEKDLSFIKNPTIPPVDIAKANPPQQPATVAQTVVQTPAPIQPVESPVFIPAKIQVAITALPMPRPNKLAEASFNRSVVASQVKNIVLTGPPAFIPERVEPTLAIAMPMTRTKKFTGAAFNRSLVAGKLRNIVILPLVDKDPPKKDIAVNNPPVAKPKVVPPPMEKPKAPPVIVAKETPAKQNPPAKDIAKNLPVNETAKPDTKKPAEIVSAPVKTEVAKNEITPKKDPPAPVVQTNQGTAAAKVAERKMAAMQSVDFVSDSLVFTLYDNGDVDGDTVSVLMNGQILFSRQGLTTRANSKTVYTNNGNLDSIMLVMYAENLGSIPPNTGLLMVTDGAATYYVRFTADLQNNAAILLRRKKNE